MWVKKALQIIALTISVIILAGCNILDMADPGRVRWNYPDDLTLVSGFSIQADSWINAGVVRVRIVDTYAFLATSEADIIVLDISDPSKLSSVSEYATGWDKIDDMAVQDQLLFLVSKDEGLVIIDFSDPTNLVKKGKYEQQSDRPTSIIVIDQFVYFYAPVSSNRLPEEAGWLYQEPHLHILDITDVNSPKLVRDLSEIAQPMAISNNYLYTGGRWTDGPEPGQSGSKLQVIDVSDPANPIQVSEVRLQGWIHDIVIHEKIAFIGLGNGINIMDVSDPIMPQIIRDDLYRIGTFQRIAFEHNILVGGFVWVVQAELAHDTVDVRPLARLDQRKLGNRLCSDPHTADAEISYCSPIGFHGTSNDIALNNGYVYVATDVNGLLVFNMQNE
jgi:hypothetical protein